MPRDWTGRHAGSAILGSLGVGLTLFAIYLLIQAFLPSGGAFVMSILIPPVLMIIGIVVLASAVEAWRGYPAGRTGSMILAGMLGTFALYGAASALGIVRPGGGAPTDGPPGKLAAGLAAAQNAATPPVDVIVLGLWLVLAAACLAVVLLLWLGWSPRTTSRGG